MNIVLSIQHSYNRWRDGVWKTVFATRTLFFTPSLRKRFFFLFHKGATGGGGGGGNTGFASGTLSLTAILRKVKTLSLSSVVHCCIKIYIEDIY